MMDHDGLYHQLYAHPPMMADLLRQFVDESWVAGLDLAHMEPVKAKFHVPGLPKRESDVIWRIPLHSGSELYLLVLLEFQSESNRWMILRVVVYMCLLWLQLLHEKNIPATGPLPPLFPVVLHNGDKPWLTPVCMKELIDLPEASPLWRYQPEGQFFLIDEGRFSKEDLEKRDSLSSLVFQVEQCINPEELPTLAKAIIAWLDRHPEFADLRQVLAAMLLNAMTTLGGEDSSPATKDPINLLEVPTMLQTRMEAWKEAWKESWKSQKHQEWYMEGQQEEAIRTLQRLLHRKFGPARPADFGEKLKAATLEEIETWTDRILDAQSLNDVFTDQKND
ncbi:MAG: Rpn family recombination-promoting nuclease/putative transposase [Magnetococcales bacterium]|nr:Rpn family recombination-promoting nuclease/putative transposase [Magnetococcales bacterium]MBF0348942.1 Rpn family recombination-promoting nuclease/putative transposase [Magnetococcales bacterium]MBF0632450.1 Rpn family recombination-promoting nuclease/putative transposase [Magnetococcales bacterium]